MRPIRIAITFAADSNAVAMIRGVAPGVEVADVTPLLEREQETTLRSPELDRILSEIEVLFLARIPRDLADRVPSLKWLHFTGTGLDMMSDAGLLGRHFTVTNTTGLNSRSIAENCLLFLLMFMKRAPIWVARQKERRYDRSRLTQNSLEGKTLGVLGMGPIGLEVARLGKAFRMRTLGLRRNIAGPQRSAGDFDEVYPRPMLRELLAQCDCVVVALPLTAETQHIIGEPELRAMRPSAYVVNVARGKLIDEPALVRALQEGRIAGAGLDVFETEPLPQESPLWEMPNVLLTPHVAGQITDHQVGSTRFFCEQLRRYVNGEPLRNIADPARGY